MTTLYSELKSRYSALLLCLVLVFTSLTAPAVVTVMDGGIPVANQTVTITLPGAEPQEAESDDDGILFWLNSDGSRGTRIDSLPDGSQLSGGYDFTSTTGWSTAKIVGVTAGVIAGGFLIADTTESDSSSRNNSSPADDPVVVPPVVDPPAQPGPAMLGVMPAELDLSREVDSACPATIGNFDVKNDAESGSESLSWNATVDNSNMSLSPTSGSVAAGGGSQTVTAQYLCNPDDAGTSTGTATINGGSAGTEMVSLTVNSSAAQADPGMLVNDGPNSLVAVHFIGSTSCPQSLGTIVIRNGGGTALVWNLGALDPFLNTSGASSGTLEPGETIEIAVSFPCAGFIVGDNIGEVNISAPNGGSVTVPVRLTVNN